MPTLGLSILELLEIVRVCGTLQVEKCPSSYLSDYLAVGLAPLDPDLAAKVRRFDETELDALSAYVQELQSSLHPRRLPGVEAVPAG